MCVISGLPLAYLPMHILDELVVQDGRPQLQKQQSCLATRLDHSLPPGHPPHQKASSGPDAAPSLAIQGTRRQAQPQSHGRTHAASEAVLSDSQGLNATCGETRGAMRMQHLRATPVFQLARNCLPHHLGVPILGNDLRVVHGQPCVSITH